MADVLSDSCPHCGDDHQDADGDPICPRTGAGLASPGPCGSQIDRYLIMKLLQSGGYGSVYLARHVHTKKRVALKILTDELASDPTQVKRFEREAQAMAAIDSPNIVQVNDWGALPDGKVFLVMELLEGSDLRTVLEQEGPLPVERSVAIALQVLDALDAAHSLGIVHRDLKPANIFLLPEADGDGLVKLLDFGISKIADDAVPPSSRLVTKTGEAMGTPRYMAPEQLRADRDVDGRVDVYACAVVLYRMLAGRPPYDAQCYEDLIVRVCTEEAPTLEEVAPWVSRALSDVVARGLRRERDERWPDAPDFGAALREALEDPDTARFARLAPEGGSAPASEAGTIRDSTAATRVASSSTPAVSDGSSGGEEALATDAATADRQDDTPASVASADTPASRTIAEPPPKSRVKTRSSAGLIAAACVIGISAVVSSWLLSRSRIETVAVSPGTTLPSSVDRTSSRVAPTPVASVVVTSPPSEPPSASPDASMPTEPSAPRPAQSTVAAPAATVAAVLTKLQCARDADCPSRRCTCKHGNTLSPRRCSVADGRCVDARSTCPGACSAAGFGKFAGSWGSQISQDGDCRSACESYGLCVAREGSCIATSDAACRKSKLCANSGRCFVGAGVCVPRNAEDCRRAHACLDVGTCGYADGHCIALSEADCLKAIECAKRGRCRLVDGACRVTRDADCAASRACQRYKQCRALGDRCQR